MLFSFVLAHSSFPHHHHLAKPISEHHHHHDEDHHQHDEDDDHSVFSFSQIDDIFINGKQLNVPIAIAFVPTPCFTFVVSEEDVKAEYLERDIHRPPLISIAQPPFRGPPCFS
jgi:hypothetical protein